MKNQLTLLLANIIILPVIAMDAPALKVSVRSDYLSSKTETKNSTNVEDSVFKVPYARLDVNGKVASDLSYRVKFRLNKTHDISGRRDELPEAVDYAYFQKSFGENIKVKFGKQYYNLGGFEGMYSTIDLYARTSEVFRIFEHYRTGLGLFADYWGQEINVQMVNRPSIATGTKNSKSIGFQYVGSFAEGVFQPLFSFHQKHDQVNIDYMALGFRTKVSNLLFELDYLVNTTEADKAIGDTKEDKVTSLSALAKVTFDQLAPQLRYSSSKSSPNEVELFSVNDYALALEYTPYEGKNFRYHVAYIVTDKDYKNDSLGNDSKTTSMAVGLAGTF